MAQRPSRPEARSRFGSQTANELGAPVASSIPEQLRGREPASARKGYEDALVLRNRRVEGSSGRDGVARRVLLFGAERPSRLGDIEQLRGFSITAIGIEASGGYERGAVRSLQAAGMPVRQVNPFKLRQFAKASGVLAKNDPLDARMIASFVGIMPTRPAQPTTPAAEQLVEMLAVRRQLSAEKTAAENASRLLEDLMLQRLSRRRITRLAADIKLLDTRLVEIVATDATLAHRYRLLTSMPGVGPVLACTLIALLPELGGMSRKQVAALIGVAPYAFESGTL